MNVLRALATVSGLTMLSRVTGLVREITVAALFGVSAATDAFNVAFRIPNLLRRLFAEGAFSQAFVPILGEIKARQGEAAAQALIDQTATLLCWLLVAVTIAGVVGAPVVVWCLAAGLHAEGSFDLAVLLTRIMFPYIFFISLVSAASGVLNTWRHFAVPAFTPVLLNVSIVGCALGLSGHIEPRIAVLAIGVVVGGVAQLALQLPALAAIGRMPRLHLSALAAWRYPGVQRVVRQMVPATLAVSVAQLSLIINTQIATWIGTGSVSWLTYADRLMEFPTALLGVALGTILTPLLSQARATGEHAQYEQLLDWGLRLALLLALPCAVALVLLAGPLSATLFERGAFTANDAAKTASAVAAYGVGLVGLVLVKILASAFYARQDLRTPVKIAIGVLIATQLMNIVFVPLYAHAGLALSIALGACANALFLFMGLLRAKAIELQTGWPVYLARLGVALVVLAAGLWWAGHALAWDELQSHPWQRVGVMAGVVAAGAALYFGTLWVSGLRIAQFRGQA